MSAQIRRRPSLLSGLFWAAVGVLFLLHNFGIVANVWALAARYWPIILILLGLGKVLDYYRHQSGIAIRIGEVLLILILVVIGSALSRVADRRFPDLIREISIPGTSVRPGQWVGTSHTYYQEASYPITASTPLRIENAYGLVSLAPGSDGEIRVRLKKVVYEDDEQRAKAIASEITLAGAPQGQAEAAAFLIKTNREDLSSKDYRFNTDLEVYVPKKTSVQVANSFGELRAASLEGKLDLTTTHNILDVRDCTGTVKASNRFADSRFVNLTGNLDVDARGRVYLETIKGDVNISDEYSPVEVNDVDGQVTVSNTESSITIDKVSKAVVVDARGTQIVARNLSQSLTAKTSHRRVQVSDVESNVALETQYSTVSFKGVRGNVDVASNSDQITAEGIQGYFKVKGRGSRVRANSVTGPVDIQTTLKDVVVNDFSSGCSVTDEYGDVSLTAMRLDKAGVNVKTRNGDIELFVPRDAGFVIDATTRSGKVDSNIPDLAPAAGGEPDVSTLKGRVKGGGPRITLETEYSNIRIRQKDSDSSRSVSD
jgi:DUF4097 and DUF4098 domain-containing protein YvlB